MSKVIALDCDGVLSDFVHGVMRFAKQKGLPYTRDQITQFNIFKAWGEPELWTAFNEEVFKAGWVSSLPVVDGAAQFVEGLRELGHVVVVTSPYKGAPFWMQERNEWLAKYFQFSQDDIIHATHKHLIKADLLIDDAAHNVETWPGKSILIDQPWNRNTDAATVRAANLRQALNHARIIL